MRVVFASNNNDKLEEIRKILSDFEILSLKDVDCDIDVEEEHDSFYLNALFKAKEIYDVVKIPVIADDSGICVKELDMWPGVMTKRFYKGYDQERNLEIIKKVNEVFDRTAFFRCSLVYYDGNDIIEGKGVMNGKIVHVPRGEDGFGFDSIFELENGKTLAEISSDEKNKCSARYLASVDLRDKLLSK